MSIKIIINIIKMDITTSDIPRDVSAILIDLNIISRIPTNHKLNIYDKTYVDADSFLYAIKRWRNAESSDTTIDFINSTIDNAITICRNYPSWTELIATQISNLSNSLRNLEDIYLRKRSESTVGKINLIKIRIDKERFLRACTINKNPTINTEHNNPVLDNVKTSESPIEENYLSRKKDDSFDLTNISKNCFEN